jgi:hypothetical protein
MDKILNTILTANQSALVEPPPIPTVREFRLARALKLLTRDLDDQDPRKEAIERICTGE